MIDEFTEKRFGHLRELSRDEKLAKIQELQEDIEYCQEAIDDRTTSGEQRTELYSDITYDREVIDYLNAVMEEKQR